MNPAAEDLIKKICIINQEIVTEARDFINKFFHGDDDDYPYVVLFGCMADSFVSHSESMSEDQKRRVMDVLDRAIIEGDSVVGTAVCTGFLEALYNTAQGSGNIDIIERYVLGESKKYLDAWVAS